MSAHPIRGPRFHTAWVALLLSSAAPLSAQQLDSSAAAPPLFTRGDAVAAAGVTAATAAFLPLDERIARSLQRPVLQNNRALRRTATGFRLLGSPGVLLMSGTFYVAGRVSHTRGLAAAGLHGAEAIVLAEVAGGLIKWTSGRARPFAVGDSLPHEFQFLRGMRKGYDYSSFPSGHTIAGFAAAAAFTSEAARSWPHSGWLIGPVLYGSASLVGLSRMYNDQHWASDVVFGAGLGTFVGIKVDQYTHNHSRNRLDRWLLSATITPAPDGGNRLVLSVMPSSSPFVWRSTNHR
jgi:membrane-associated phospholipid phosphatase